MTSKEIISRIIGHNEPPRFGMDFKNDNPCDFRGSSVFNFLYPYDKKLAEWGYHAELLQKLNNFTGEVRLNEFGDIFGRLRGETAGECVKGCFEDGWDIVNDYNFPDFDPEFDIKVLSYDFRRNENYTVGFIPFGVFSRFRDARRLENALADTLLEPGYVKLLMQMELKLMLAAVRKAAYLGFDSVMFCDDFGTQQALLLSPEVFRNLFKPVYAAFAGEAHALGLKVIMHSCGMIYEIIPDLIEAGIDVLQLDQPELYGAEVLAKEFGNKTVFYSPVDIQKIMPTGDRNTIEAGALHMMDCFRKHCGGGLIIKDYGNWQDIHVTEEWAQWARDVVAANAEI